MSRLISDVGVLQDFITWSITGLFRSVFTLLGIIVAMLILNWQLALVTFAVMPLMGLLTNYWRVRVRDAYRATRQRLSLINGYLNESISGIRVTKSFTRETLNMRNFNDLNHSYFDANVDATRLTAIFFPGVDFMGSLATALGRWRGRLAGDRRYPDDRHADCFCAVHRPLLSTDSGNGAALQHLSGDHGRQRTHFQFARQ